LLRILIACGWLVTAGCSDASSVRGSLYLTRWNVREPAVSVPVYALPVHNEIDQQLAALCNNDSLLNAIGEVEYPIGPVRVQGDGIELDASLPAAAPTDRRQPDTASGLTWMRRRRVYAAFNDRMDSLLRRTAIATALTDAAGSYQVLLPHPDSVELFAFTILDDRGALWIWRARVAGAGTHDFGDPLRRMHHIYCGEEVVGASAASPSCRRRHPPQTF
jgi:hypothetical protein